MGKFKYFAAYLTPALALLTFYSNGLMAYVGILVLYVLIPVTEQILPLSTENFSKEEKDLAKDDWFYDLAVSFIVPVHLFAMYVFLSTITDPALSNSDIIARVFMMGTLLGVIGINVGHELGHKTQQPFKQFLAQILLTTSVQNHFMTYHNGGHHRDIGTPKDLSSARKGENFYLFALKSQIGGYFKTWRLENERLAAKGKSKLLNPMIVYTLLPWIMLLGIYLYFGSYVFVCYFIASVYGIAILESQNFFAHYGLRRKQLENGRYEKVNAQHSWNSDHLIGRVLLFELTRHSDHHHNGAKEYQVLDSKNESPLLPYGYPAMLILSFFPFLFKPIMAKQLKVYGID